MTRLVLPFAASCLLFSGCSKLSRESNGGNSASMSVAQESSTRLASTRRLLTGFSVNNASATAPSPDGRSVAMLNEMTGDLAIRDPATGATRLLTHNTAPYAEGFTVGMRFSADGKRIAYNWNVRSGADWQLRVINADGSGARTIFSEVPSAFLGPVRWINGDREIATLRWNDQTLEMVLVPAEGGPVRVLKAFGPTATSNADLSPDGRFIVYEQQQDSTSNSHDLYLFDVQTGRETPVVSGSADDQLMGWAPDGQHLLFKSDRSGTPAVWLLTIVDGRVQGDPVLVKPDLWRFAGGSFSGNGSFAYSVGTGGRAVYVAAVDRTSGRVLGEPRRVTQDAVGLDTRIDWSPDGRSISYVVRQDRSSTAVIAIQSLETGETRRIAVPRNVNARASHRWLPDGSALLMKSGGMEPHGLALMDAQTGRVKSLFTIGREFDIVAFDVAPSGREIAYRAERVLANRAYESQVRVRDLKSGIERELYRGAEGGTNRFPRVEISPDGQMVAFIRRSPGSDGAYDIVVAPLRGGEPRRVTSFSDSSIVRTIDWTADGRALLIAQDVPAEMRHEVRRVSVAGGPAEPIGLTMAGISQLRVHPSGNRIAFAGGVASSELWLMEGILPR